MTFIGTVRWIKNTALVLKAHSKLTPALYTNTISNSELKYKIQELEITEIDFISFEDEICAH